MSELTTGNRPMLFSLFATSVIFTTLAIAALAMRPAFAKPKEGSGTAQCACVCRQESGNNVTLANVGVSQPAGGCGSLNATSCSHTVVTSDGSSYTVNGKYEGCTSGESTGGVTTHQKVPIAVKPTAGTKAHP